MSEMPVCVRSVTGVVRIALLSVGRRAVADSASISDSSPRSYGLGVAVGGVTALCTISWIWS
jgi:hypothetical protein